MGATTTSSWTARSFCHSQGEGGGQAKPLCGDHHHHAVVGTAWVSPTGPGGEAGGLGPRLPLQLLAEPWDAELLWMAAGGIQEEEDIHSI